MSLSLCAWYIYSVESLLISDKPALCDVPVDLVFVIDSSGSINFAGAGNWDRLLKFVNDIVAKRTIGADATRVGVVRYSDDVVNSVYLNQYYSKTSLMDAISGITYEGRSTNTAGGIREMRTVQFTAGHGDRPGVRNVAIVITDGESRITPEQTIPEAEEAHNQDIIVYSIGVTDKVKEAEVIAISSPPHELNKNYFLATDFTNLDTIIQTIVDATCDDMTPLPASEYTFGCF